MKSNRRAVPLVSLRISSSTFNLMKVDDDDDDSHYNEKPSSTPPLSDDW